MYMLSLFFYIWVFASLPSMLFFGWLNSTSFHNWLEEKYPKLFNMFLILQIFMMAPFLIFGIVIFFGILGILSLVLFDLVRHSLSDPPRFEALPAELVKAQEQEELNNCNDYFVEQSNLYNDRYKERLEEWLEYCYPQILDDKEPYKGLMPFDKIKLKTGIQNLSYAAANEIVKENRENALKNISAGITTTEEEKECAASFLEIESTNRPINLCIYGVYVGKNYDVYVGVIESLKE